MPSPWTAEELGLVAERAYQLHLQGRDQEALTIFEGLVTIEPRNVYCLEALAALQLKAGAADRAVDYASRALAFSPRAIDAMACRCEANVMLNRITLAQQDLEMLKGLRANTQVARLNMRINHATKSSKKLLSDATLPPIDR
jgi:predicted Zn-dependent protease